MSLATTGGGGFAGAGGAAVGGGIALAHSGGSTVAVQQPIPPQNTASGATSSSTTNLPPPLLLGTDICDKTYGLTLKNVRNVAHLPIVAIDLFGNASKPYVAYFPPKQQSTTPTPTVDSTTTATTTKAALLPVVVSKISTNVTFQCSDMAQKTLRKYLAKTKSYTQLRTDSLVMIGDSTKASLSSNVAVVTIPKPQRWLGIRRLKDVPESIRQATTTSSPSVIIFDDDNNHTKKVGSSEIIDEEPLQGIGCCLMNGSIDNGQPPIGGGNNHYDTDRVVYKIRLSEQKKVTTLLPEEIVEMIFDEAKYHVAQQFAKSNSSSSKNNSSKNKKVEAPVVVLDESEMEDFPCAVAIPSWACYDASIEALLDVMGNNSNTSIIVQRNVAALVGAVVPSLDGNITPLLQRLHTVHVALQKEHQKRLLLEPNLHFDDDITIFVLSMIEQDGFEITAIQISCMNTELVSCIFGNYKVLCNVSILHIDPITQMESLTKQLEETLDKVAYDVDGPAAMIVTGTVTEQKQIVTKWDTIKTKFDDWKKVPIITTNEDCIAKGTAILAGVAHGRLSIAEKGRNSTKPKMTLGIRVQNVIPCAIGVQMNYQYDKANPEKHWTPVKTIFDFDRPIPAGPHVIELSAAECAVYRSGTIDPMAISSNTIDEEVLHKAIKANEGRKNIPIREDAALHFSVRIVQLYTRNSEGNNWIQVGDTMEPLVIEKTNETMKNKNAKDDSGSSSSTTTTTTTRVGCERIVWELSVGITGMITTAFVGERESVVVATKSARNSTIRYYLGMIFAILFFGGFLFKSYWDEYVLNRDTARLLAYYKHVVPGSYQDGDRHNARYTCYKYRHKKAKLWRNLEKKYGIPVLTVKEYEMMDKETTHQDTSNKGADSEDETVDLDDVDETKEEEGDEL